MASPKFSQLEKNLYTTLLENKAKHSDAIADLQARLDEAEEALTSVAYERNVLQCTVDELQERSENLSLELEESRSIFSLESANWREEKRRTIDEKNKLMNRISDIENTLVDVCDQRAALEAQKTDIERELSRVLSENEGKHNKTIADVQARFQDTEHQLANVKAEKEKLQQMVRDLQEINHKMSLETAEAKSIFSQKSKEWDGVKAKLINSLKESEETLVLISGHKENLEKKIDEEKETLTNRLTETEKRLVETERTLVLVASRNEELKNKLAEGTKTLEDRLTKTAEALVVVASHKQMLEKKNAAREMMLRTEAENALVATVRRKQQLEKKYSWLERKSHESSPLRLPPRQPQNEMSAEMLSFLKEERDKLVMQQGLERMLMEPLSFDKENAEEKKPVETTPRNTCSWKENRVRSEPRVRALSRPRMPLSPTGSVISPTGARRSPTSSATSPTGSMRSSMRSSPGSMPSHRRGRSAASIDP